MTSESVDVLIRSREAEDEILIEAVGSGRRVAGAVHILYEDPPDGDGRRTKNHVVIRDDCVEVHRRGEASADFLFAAGRVTRTDYRTPYHAFSLDVHTKKISIRPEGDRIGIRLQYALASGGSHLRDVTVEMDFRSSLFLF